MLPHVSTNKPRGISVPSMHKTQPIESLHTTHNISTCILIYIGKDVISPSLLLRESSYYLYGWIFSKGRIIRRQEDQYKDSELDRGRTEHNKKEERHQRKREKRVRQAMQAAQSSEPMIVVNVNDHLGTKAAILCLASDPISMFPVHLPVMLCQVANLFCRAIQSTGSHAHRM